MVIFSFLYSHGRYDMVSPIVYVQRDGVAAAVKSGLCVKIGALMMGNAVLTQTPAYSQPASECLCYVYFMLSFILGLCYVYV